MILKRMLIVLCNASNYKIIQRKTYSLLQNISKQYKWKINNWGIHNRDIDN
jgi:hypothetical protein